MEDVAVGEDFGEVGEGAVLGDVDGGSVFEFDVGFFGAVRELKGALVEDVVFQGLFLHGVGWGGRGGGLVHPLRLLGEEGLRGFVVAPSEPEDEKAEADKEGGDDVADAIGGVFCGAGEAGARWGTGNDNELEL